MRDSETEYDSDEFDLDEYLKNFKTAIPASVQDKMLKMVEIEKTMSYGEEKKLEEIKHAPPLEDVLKVFLPESLASQLVDLLNHRIKNDEEKANKIEQSIHAKRDEEITEEQLKKMKYEVQSLKESQMYAAGLSAMLTRSLLTPEFQNNEESFLQRWKDTLSAMTEDKETRDLMFPMAHNFLGDCLEPMLEALNEFENAMEGFEVKLVQHDPVSLINFAITNKKEKYKKSLISSMAEILRPVVSREEFVETHMELELHLGRIFKLKKATKSMANDGGGGTSAYRTQLAAIGDALLKGDAEKARQEAQPLLQNMERTITSIAQLTGAENAATKISLHEKIDELTSLPYDPSPHKNDVLLGFAHNLFEQEPEFDSIRNEEKSLVEEQERVQKEIDQLPDVPPPPLFKRTPEMSNDDYQREKVVHEKKHKDKYEAYAEFESKYNPLDDRQIEIHKKLGELRAKKTEIYTKLIDQFILVKEITERQLESLRREKKIPYHPPSTLNDDRLDKKLLEYPIIKERIAQMQFQLVRNAGKEITVVKGLTQSDIQTARIAAQLAGIAISGWKNSKHHSAEDDASFQTELKGKLVQMCRFMPESALRKQFRVHDESDTTSIRLHGGITVSRNEEGNSFVRPSGTSATPKFGKVSATLQKELSIMLYPEDIIEIQLKIGRNRNASQKKTKIKTAG